MKVRIPGYSLGFRVVSLSLDEETKEDLEKEKVDFIYIQTDTVTLFPEQFALTKNKEIAERFKECNNYDVFEISEHGIISRCYDDTSIENTFFVTERCNSNCIMCPSPDYSRRRGESAQIGRLIMIASHIPSDVSHITITGGEPFLIGREIFRLLDYCKNKFFDTEFQILTNGRVFSLRDYCELLVETIPNNTILGIPLHGSNEDIHDNITQTPNSFTQTLIGLKNLQRAMIRTEIRIVVNRMNVGDLSNIAELIVNQLYRVAYVSIMAMEMTGSAYVNSNKVWISYRESFLYVKNAIDILMKAGIDVRLYNFPLCTVYKTYRTLCYKSISSWKVRYVDACERCRLKNTCGGVFAGSLKFEAEELKVDS